jgi:predicted O-linked N-acetylglucosamine transferase (SPINDLY family)
VEDHLARYRHADLFLDTFPYGGHTTASDALLMGTPVVTLAGRSFASRVAGCMLTDLGLSKGIASSMDEYFDIAQSMIGASTLAPRAGHTFPSAEQLAEAFSQSIEQMS